MAPRYHLVWHLAVVCAVLFWTAGQVDGQLPTSNAAVEAAVRNPRYMRRQMNCLLNEAPCDNIGRTMKRKSLISIIFWKISIDFILIGNTQNWCRHSSEDSVPDVPNSNTAKLCASCPWFLNSTQPSTAKFTTPTPDSLVENNVFESSYWYSLFVLLHTVIYIKQQKNNWDWKTSGKHIKNHTLLPIFYYTVLK